MGKLHTFKLRKCLEKMTAQFSPTFGATFQLGGDLATEIINRVVATPQNTVVGGEAVIVKLIRNIGESLTTQPSNAL